MSFISGVQVLSVAPISSRNVFAFISGTTTYNLILPSNVNENDNAKQVTDELIYYRGFLESVMKKLSNEKFVTNAKPDVIEKERKKADDAKEKIRLLEEQLAQ